MTLKYAKLAKHAIIPKIYINMQQKLFSVYFLLNKSSTFFTPMKLRTLKKKSVNTYNFGL